MIIFVLWAGFFATEFFVLKTNRQEAKDYQGIPNWLGYFFLAFENGIGNISSPSLNEWTNVTDSTISSKLIIYMVYFVWFMNQFILLIVLLNFVIALISEVYERVMD